MRILVVAPYAPFPSIRHAGGEYLYRHLAALVERGHEVTLIVPSLPEQLLHVADAPPRVRVLAGPPAESGRSFARRLLDAAYRRAMNSPPAPNAESLRSIYRAGLVDEAARADLVELHWSEYARFASALRRARVSQPIIAVEYDVDLHAAIRRARQNARGYRLLLALVSAPLAARQERRGLRHADLVLLFKQDDEGELRRSSVPTPVRVIDPTLDDVPLGTAIDRTPNSVLFTGALWRQENERSIIWFLEEVWPLVVRTVDGAVLRIVGSGPTERLRAVARATVNVDVVGEVPDLMPYYCQASLFVAPLLVPGGLKFKVPQAMRCELPVVATTVAVQGIEDAPRDALWEVTDDPATMAARIVDGLRDPDRAAEVGRNGAAWCLRRFSFDRSMNELVEEYERLVAAR